MNYDDWMKASDYNNLRTAILNGHQHTGGSDGPLLNNLSFKAGSITRDRFTTRDKYIFAHCYVCDFLTSAEVVPTFSSTYNWGRDAFLTTDRVDVSATLPYPYDIVGSSLTFYLHVSNISPFSITVTFTGAMNIKVINAGNSNRTTITSFSNVTVGASSQMLVFLGSASPTALSQPAMISVHVAEIMPDPVGSMYFNGIVLKYTGRP